MSAFTFPKGLADKTSAMAKSRSLSWRLGVLTLIIVLPLVVFALMMVGWIAYSDREATRNALVDDAHGLAADDANQDAGGLRVMRRGSGPGALEDVEPKA